MCVCSAHMPLHALPMKLMEIEPLKALSSFCSGGQLMATQTETKASNLSLYHLSLLERQLEHSQYPRKIPQVCLCFCKSLHLTSPYFTMEPIYNDARKIKPRQTEANATLMETFYFGGEWVAGGSMVFFAFQMLAGKWAVIWVSM